MLLKQASNWEDGSKFCGGFNMDSLMSITKEVRHYVVRNVVATLGMSMYVIIDTLFISIAAGALGLTTLNLVLPLFNVFNHNHPSNGWFAHRL